MKDIIIGVPMPEYPEIVLQTRRGNDSNVRNSQINEPLSSKDLHDSEIFKRSHNFATFRTGPCGYYNCHGLTFASRRTRIFEAADISKILYDDNYVLVDEKDVLPGDIIMYYRNGDPQHSGIVIYIPMQQEPIEYLKILSKWGSSHEVVHLLKDCPYYSSCDSILFYRIESVFHKDRL